MQHPAEHHSQASTALDLPALQVLNATARLLLQDRDPDTLCQSVFENLRDSHAVDLYFHYLVTPDGEHLELASSGGNTTVRDAIGSRIDFGAAVCGNVALRQQSMYVCTVHDRDDLMTAYIRGVGARSYACFPLLANGRLLGTLSFGSTSRSHFQPHELELFALIAEQVTLATERRRQIAELQNLERLATAGRMSATLAHEINNPLHCLQLYLDELASRVQAPDATALLQRAQTQVDQLAGITQRTLRMFRGAHSSTVRCDLSRLAQELVLDARLPGHARLTSAIEPSLWVHAIPGELQQVIFNLLLNAAQFTPAGREIRLEIRRSTSSANIHVADQGPGIPHSAQDRIFQPFFTTRGSEGTGIGLWASREMVRRIGGDMSFHSEPHLRPGTEFVVTLPLAA